MAGWPGRRQRHSLKHSRSTRPLGEFTDTHRETNQRTGERCNVGVVELDIGQTPAEDGGIEGVQEAYAVKACHAVTGDKAHMVKKACQDLSGQ